MAEPSSALRYGLLSVKPIPYEEILKIKGRKFSQKGIRFEPEQQQTQFEKFEDFVTFRYNRIMNRMPIPEKFSADQILEYLIKYSIEHAKADSELMERIEQKEGSLLDLVDFVKKRFEKRMPMYFQSEAHRFLNSNVPMSFFVETSMYINTYQKYLQLVRRIVRRFEFLSNLGGVRDKYRKTSRQLNEMKRPLAPLIDKMDLCSTAILSLKLFITIWSAETIEEIDCPKKIDISKLDKAYFKEYSVAYNSEIKSMRRMLFAVSKSYEPDLFTKETVTPNSTSNMIGRLLTVNSVCRF